MLRLPDGFLLTPEEPCRRRDHDATQLCLLFQAR